MNRTGITARQIRSFCSYLREGVFRTKNGRWRVSIGFKGKRYYIGSYESYDEAVEMRVNAENPFLFEVEKRDGELKIISNN